MQIARHWWSSGEGDEEKRKLSATRRLHQMCKAEILARQWVSVIPELDLSGPEFEWSPGDETPHFGKLAWRVQSRWKEAPIPTEIYQIGRAGLREFGGREGGPKKVSHLRHDLHIGTMYLALVEADSLVKERWISEDDLAPERIDQKLPDAMLRQYNSQSEVVIEFAGAYDSDHIRSFHEDCESRDLPYQLW